MAVTLAATCKTAYSWVMPVLYSTIVLDTPQVLLEFEAALREGELFALAQDLRWRSSVRKRRHRMLRRNPKGHNIANKISFAKK